MSGADKEIEMRERRKKNKSVTKVKEDHRKENFVTLCRQTKPLRESQYFLRFQGL